MFRWSVENELVPANVHHGLQAVQGLQRGRTTARETKPVEPITDQLVDATLPHLPQVVADMVRFQRLIGCRPGEVCMLRPCDVDTSGEVWIYVPESHKTEHHGRQRKIFIGPKAQDVLRPYLLREKTAHSFSPRDSERKRHAEMRDSRKTRVQPSQMNRRKAKPKRQPAECYTKDSYCRAIARACELAFKIPKELRSISAKLADQEKSQLRAKAATWREQHVWSPNQLRHSVATAIRRKYGIEGAQVCLGHSKADVTQVYAERDFALAERIMREVG
jgi:integrase